MMLLQQYVYPYVVRRRFMCHDAVSICDDAI